MSDPTERFSGRVENYAKYRPSYPVEILGVLRQECGLTPASTVADIGSGTGILASLFLDNGNVVYCVEPNDEMREEAERSLKRHPGFRSIRGTAEATTLPEGSVQLITAGQAFHWFDREKAAREFLRILARGGWVILIWNERKVSSTPFLREYEHLLVEYGTDYEQVDHRRITEEVLRSFFGSAGFSSSVFGQTQRFDLEGLRGRLLSSSYVPDISDPRSPAMLAALADLFHKHQVGDRVSIEYETKMYYGRLHDHSATG